MEPTLYNRFNEDMELKHEGKKAEEISNILNRMGIKLQDVGRALAYDHRELQNSFWQVIRGFIEEQAAKPSYFFDDRNRYVGDMCKKIMEQYEKMENEVIMKR